MNRVALAQRISLIFSPVIWASLAVLFLLWFFLKNGSLTWPQLLFLLIVFLFLPLSFFFWSIKKGRFDFDLTKREERFRFFIFAIACSFLGLNLTFYFSESLFKIFLVLIISGLVFTVVTFWDKASLHVGILTSIYLVLNLLFRWYYFYLIPVIPLVAWSRIVLGKHRLSQVLEGFIIPLITIPVGFSLLKII